MNKICLSAAVAAFVATAVYASPATDLPAPSGNEPIITTAPAGTTGYYAKRGRSWAFDYEFYMPYQISADGCVAEIVLTDDNKMYMAPAFSFGMSRYEKSYIVGQVSDGKVTFSFPQPIAREEVKDKAGNITLRTTYIMMMEFAEDEEGYWDLVPCQNQKLIYNIAADGTLTPVDDLVDTWMAAALWGHYKPDDTTDGWYWAQTCGDWYTSLTPVTAETPAMPADVAAETWTVINGENAYEVKVGVKDSDIYIAGLFEKMPDAVIAGKITSGMAVFPPVSYLGIYQPDFHNVYAMSVKSERVKDPDLGLIDSYVPDGKNIVFSYNAAESKLTGRSNVGFSFLDDKYIAVAPVLEKPLIEKPADIEITAISKPLILAYWPYDDREGYGIIEFKIANNANDGMVIPTAKLYFSLYMDGEIYEFEPDDYNCFKTPTSVVPYRFNDDSETFAIMYDPTAEAQLVGLFVQGFDTIGVQAVYRDGDKEVRSEIASIPGKKEYVYDGKEDSVETIDADGAEPVQFFDLQGRAIGSPRPGQILIRKAGASARIVRF